MGREIDRDRVHQAMTDAGRRTEPLPIEELGYNGWRLRNARARGAYLIHAGGLAGVDVTIDAGPPPRPPWRGRCWICGALDDHGGSPHSQVLGDHLTRRLVADLVNHAGGRQLVHTCGERFVRRPIAYLCGGGGPGPVYGQPYCPRPECVDASERELRERQAAREQASIADAIARGVIDP